MKISPDLVGKPHTDPIWTWEDGGQNTAEDAMNRFAYEFWDKPRKIENFTGNLFTVEDGIHTYRLDYIREEGVGDWPRRYWAVSRIIT